MPWNEMRWTRVGCVRYVQNYGLFVDHWDQPSTSYFLYPAVSDDNKTGWVLVGHREDDEGHYIRDFVAAAWYEQFRLEPTVVIEQDTPPTIISRAAEMIAW